MIRFGVWRTKLRGGSEVSKMKCANEKRGKAGINGSVNFRGNPRKVKGVRPVQRSRFCVQFSAIVPFNSKSSTNNLNKFCKQ